jgi:GTP pyrophosphokinase/guanosine-3',5'-bis(diphosphate) 3'-pyrophosphohydrolase
LKNGDLVEIVTSPQSKPNPVWLTYVKTGRARSKIRHFLRTMQNEESARLGERLLRQELLSLGVVPISIPAAAWDQMVKSSGQKSMEDLYTEIGLGKRLPSVVARRLLAREDMSHDSPSGMTLAIHGTEGMAIQLASCCQPIPGDPIIGSIRKGSGLVIHTHDCATIRKSRSSEPQKWIDVEWEPEEGKLFDIRIRVEVKILVACSPRWRLPSPRRGRTLSMWRWMPIPNVCLPCSVSRFRLPIATIWHP